MTEVIAARNVEKSYRDGEKTLAILRGVNLVVHEGEQIAILGRSGSGKSTLLHILAGLDDLDSGEVLVGSESISAANSKRRARIRGDFMGFIYQFHHLLPEFTAVENVAMPLWLKGDISRREGYLRAAELLSSVGLGDRLKHLPHKLSGGEKQRVAVARALVVEPAVVLGDEMTGNLDSENAEGVLALIESLRREAATAFVVVTHDSAVAKRMERVVLLEDGVLHPHSIED
ncbi:MAG: ABC transporter ATP-binding protein [Gammaproteobacteria bacterium]|nr:ABC transporter ATP-binding protein [Gammaproteobacteria bacterium]